MTAVSAKTRVSVLTPPGSGAVATIALRGPHAWDLVRRFFRPATNTCLPAEPPLWRCYFGYWGAALADEVLLAVVGADAVEIHCHGGAQLVRILVDELQAAGAQEVPALSEPLLQLLAEAPTRRLAELLLDQWYGACAAAFRRVLEEHDGATLAELARYASLGRRLNVPWQVAIAGPPNAGKSSLLNALVGFPRAIVSPIPGTTRDAVSVTLAFDGWPVQLVDTAGLRDTSEELEAAGIARTRRWLQQADVILWLIDATTGEGLDVPPPAPDRTLLVANKCDLLSAMAHPPLLPAHALRVSARTGEGLDRLCNQIVQRLIPAPPPPGAAIPFTPALADAVEQAWHSWQRGDIVSACRLLREHLPDTLPKPDCFHPLPYINSNAPAAGGCSESGGTPP